MSNNRIELPGGYYIGWYDCKQYLFGPDRKSVACFGNSPVEKVAEFAAAMNRPALSQQAASGAALECAEQIAKEAMYYMTASGSRHLNEAKAAEIIEGYFTAHPPVNTSQPAGSDSTVLVWRNARENELVAEITRLTETLESVQSQAEAAQGNHLFTAKCPGWCYPYKDIVETCEKALDGAACTEPVTGPSAPAGVESEIGFLCNQCGMRMAVKEPSPELADLMDNQRKKVM